MYRGNFHQRRCLSILCFSCNSKYFLSSSFFSSVVNFSSDNLSTLY
jgi:hypothetical protein